MVGEHILLGFIEELKLYPLLDWDLETAEDGGSGDIPLDDTTQQNLQSCVVTNLLQGSLNSPTHVHERLILNWWNMSIHQLPAQCWISWRGIRKTTWVATHEDLQGTNFQDCVYPPCSARSAEFECRHKNASLSIFRSRGHGDSQLFAITDAGVQTFIDIAQYSITGTKHWGMSTVAQTSSVFLLIRKYLAPHSREQEILMISLCATQFPTLPAQQPAATYCSLIHRLTLTPAWSQCGVSFTTYEDFTLNSGVRLCSCDFGGSCVSSNRIGVNNSAKSRGWYKNDDSLFVGCSVRTLRTCGVRKAVNWQKNESGKIYCPVLFSNCFIVGRAFTHQIFLV